LSPLPCWSLRVITAVLAVVAVLVSPGDNTANDAAETAGDARENAGNDDEDGDDDHAITRSQTQ
jgi:hypothetical protein